MIKMPILMLFCGSLLIAGPVIAGGDVEAGKAKAEDCSDCHGADGKGDKDTPSIAGMAVDKFTLAIKEYQSGVRTKSKKMTKSANKLSDEDIANLAAYFSTLK